MEGKAQELLRRAFAMLEALERIVVVEGDELYVKEPHCSNVSRLELCADEECSHP